jgi:hypothetical protein
MFRDFSESPGWQRGLQYNGSFWGKWRKMAVLIAFAVLTGLLITPIGGPSGLTGTMAQNPPGQQQPGLPGSQQPLHAPPDTTPQPGLNPKQKQELLKSGFEQMKKDSDQLLELARSLQKDLDKGNQNVLSVKVIDKAERIEKLAKKIRNTARGY